jgi:hypothetical protein
MLKEIESVRPATRGASLLVTIHSIFQYTNLLPIRSPQDYHHRYHLLSLFSHQQFPFPLASPSPSSPMIVECEVISKICINSSFGKSGASMVSQMKCSIAQTPVENLAAFLAMRDALRIASADKIDVAWNQKFNPRGATQSRPHRPWCCLRSNRPRKRLECNGHINLSTL